MRGEGWKKKKPSEEMEVREMKRSIVSMDQRIPMDCKTTHPRRLFEKDHMKMEFFDPKTDSIVHDSCGGRKENLSFLIEGEGRWRNPYPKGGQDEVRSLSRHHGP